MERRELPKNILLLILASMLFLLVLPSAKLMGSIESTSLTSLESQIVGLVNGTRAYNYDLELEKIAFNHTLSNYSFRSAGSSGASATADWIVEQFESFGLETYSESYPFTNWNVLSQPTLVVDDDGNFSTTDDQTIIDSFQSVHYSWPTPPGGAFGDLVVLPLPPAADIDQIGMNPINLTAWNAIDTTDKIVLVGREVRWAYSWEVKFNGKLTAQPPSAVVYTWWYDWMSWVPPVFNSADGRPGRTFGPYFWDLEIPVGFVNYDDGLWIRNREIGLNVSARTEIEAVISTGLQFNIIGKLRGSVYPEKVVIICAHRDTVMCSGFCDNGAGTAGVIELAKVFSEANRTGLLQPKYTILFILFDGEELGLVGSINYVMQHKSEMDDIVAVVNIDVPGSDYLDISATDPDPATGLDLDELVLTAAEDLGIYAEALGEYGGSDDIPFIDPATGEWYYSFFWDLSAGIEDANPVESSLTIASHPTFYTEEWNTGTPGWMHTSYDNSTSTGTLDWVEIADLENQFKVTALSVIRIVRETEYTLAIDSMPTGVTFTVDSISFTTPWSGTYDESTLISLEMPESHYIGEARYYWSQWSDGVSNRSRTVTMNTNITLTAHYTGPYYTPVGGYSISTEEYMPAQPLTPYLASMAIFVLWFTAVRRKIHKRIR